MTFRDWAGVTAIVSFGHMLGINLDALPAQVFFVALWCAMPSVEPGPDAEANEGIRSALCGGLAIAALVAPILW